MMRERLEITATAVLVFCALTMAGIMVEHEWLARRAAAATPMGGREPRYFSDWQSFQSVGRRIGSPDAPATIVEFIDYECLSCQRFNGVLSRALSDMEKRHPNQVATVFIHFPLPMHRFAQLAGRTIECADAQGRFRQMHDLLFAKQDSFGLKRWAEYAAEAGVADTGLFVRCLNDSAIIERVARGYSLAEKLRLPGTPSVLVNGWLIPGVPTVAQLDSAIEHVIVDKRRVVDTARKAAPRATSD